MHTLATISRTLAKSRAPLCVLADVSGSMAANVPGSHKSRFETMRDALSQVLGKRTDFSLLAFSDTVSLAPEPSRLRFEGGGTDLLLALSTVAPQEPERLLIVSDGQTADEERCITCLDETFAWVRVDALFIGDPNDTKAQNFLRRVVRGGGQFMAETTHFLKGVTLLLEGGTAL